MASIVVGTLSLGSVAIVGVTSASAAQTTPTVTLKASAVFDGLPQPITATTSVAGTLSFTAAGAAISGCTSVATTTTSPFVAICQWTPTATGAVTLGATLTPTDTTDYTSATGTYAATVATPVQGTPGPIDLYVDTILASGSTGALAPEFGAGCEITNEFILGQTIVFRVYGNDYDLNGATLTPANVPVGGATVTIAGVATPLTLTYGNHGGVAFWTAPLATGTKTGDYDTLGTINYTVTFKTIAVAAVTKQVTATKFVVTKSHGKVVKVDGKAVYHKVSYKTTVIVTPAVAGATGTFVSNFNPDSIATLNAVPAS
jgi:hypothetical protein